MPSGTYTWGYNRDQIIRRAARLCQAIASGDIPAAQTTQDFSDALNAMVKEMGAMGIRVWCLIEGVVFLQPSQVAYMIGTGSVDHCAMANAGNGIGTWIQTTATQAAALGASSIQVAATTNASNVAISAGDIIGIQLSTGTVQWMTVSGTPVGTTVNLSATLQQAITAGAMVFDYAPAATAVRPLKIINCRRIAWLGSGAVGGLLETPMTPMLARLDYEEFPSKTNIGTPTQAFYDPLGSGSTFGRLKIWPAPPDATNGIRFTAQRPIQDFNVAGDTPDFPTEWINALVFNLAKSMSVEFGVTPEQYQMITTQAQEHLDIVQGWDRENESIYAGVSIGHR